VRLGTQHAEEAHARIGAAGVSLHNDEVLHRDWAPPLFSFTDPDGNGLVYLQDAPECTHSQAGAPHATTASMPQVNRRVLRRPGVVTES
jgi:hypothetical protein